MRIKVEQQESDLIKWLKRVPKPPRTVIDRVMVFDCSKLKVLYASTGL